MQGLRCYTGVGGGFVRSRTSINRSSDGQPFGFGLKATEQVLGQLEVLCSQRHTESVSVMFEPCARLRGKGQLLDDPHVLSVLRRFFFLGQ